MKQPKSINSETITTVTFLLKLLIAVAILTVLSGGDSWAFERQKYKVIVTRPGKNITTQLRVYAENEEEARENVALNGWQILSIEAAEPAQNSLMRGDAELASFNVNITKSGNGEVEPMGDVQVTGGDSLMLSFKPGPCEKVGKLIFNGKEITPTGAELTLDSIEKDSYAVAIFEQNGSECADNGILSSNLTEVGAVYFDLGKFRKELTDEEKAVVNAAVQNKPYVIIGHTDDVKVIPNEKFSDNFQLSVKRAQFLLNKLAEKSISADRIKVIGLGPAFPAAPNKKEGQPLNRRAVLYERRN